jgi:hypothetical protein
LGFWDYDSGFRKIEGFSANFSKFQQQQDGVQLSIFHVSSAVTAGSQTERFSEIRVLRF